MPAQIKKTETTTPTVEKRDFPFRRGNAYYINFPVSPNEIKEVKLPSVTTILSTTVPKQQILMRWAAKKVAESIFDNPSLSMEEALGSYQQFTKNAQDLGTTIHHFAEDYANGQQVDINTLDEKLKPYAEAFMQFIDLHKPRVLFTEVCVFNLTHGYAGTADLIAILSNGKTAILDWKTGKNTYKESHLQQMAYANAEWIYTKDKKVIPMVKVDEQYLVHLKSNGTAHLIPVKEDFSKFTKLLNVYPVCQWLAEW
jgi:hypothetical protein